MSKGKEVFNEFILPIVISQVLIAGCSAGWVCMWIKF